LVDNVFIKVSERLEPFLGVILKIESSVLTTCMDTERLLWEFIGLNSSLVIIEDPILSLGTVLSLDKNFTTLDFDDSVTRHSGVD
jgi:hypothetical protein